MSSKKILTLVKEIKHICEYGIKPKDGAISRRFGMGDISVVIQGHDNVKKFNDSIDQIWKYNKEIYETISLTSIEKSIIEIIRNSFESKTDIEANSVEDFKNGLLAIEKQEWEVFRQIYGITIQSENPVQFGQFSIYNWQKHRNIILKKYEDVGVDRDVRWDDNEFLISVKINSRDSDRAKDLADEKFIQAENIIRYMEPDISHRYSVGILNYNGLSHKEAVLISSKSISTNSQVTGGMMSINMEDVYFQSAENGNCKVWEITSKNNKSDIEKRLLTAIEWIGKGVNDFDDAKAFMQFIFAIEGLLQHSENCIVTPSISSQISEYAAFIISDILKDRIEIEKMFKELYSRRSAIAHGGSQSVLKEDLSNALWLSKMLVMKILTSPELSNVNSIRDIQLWVKNKKYS